jgi:hypothetical protein
MRVDEPPTLLLVASQPYPLPIHKKTEVLS